MADSSPIALIVGLGNPGAEYERTRHNIGFMAVDRLAQAWGIKLAAEKRFQGIVGEGRAFTGGKIRLLKPTTFMNASGQSVRSLIDWYKCEPASVLVIYDDMDLPLGKIRLRQSGSAGGHNGMKSIIAHLGTQAFPRLRLGIGRGKPEHTSSTISHVLSGFSAEEAPILPELFRLTESVVTGIGKDGIEKTMSLYNSASVSI
ncbi:aminoacyl-tRNA hydrolase [Tumidithrix elongata RA019]|uniref:Peptidyl-tRNA hydrolase n=1 Tax=Tumidithrix elongata BACA0141 TaxID=2716417 RepID=A0AAW9PX23_9CYAN|nr:aminoacyl-tRNA hydrolase [Tumidithrix elongata RA019]